MKSFVLKFLASSLIVMFIVGCSDNDVSSNSIIGKWNSSQNTVIEFCSDGTWQQSITDNNRMKWWTEGIWTEQNGSILMAPSIDDNYNRTISYQINGNTLVLTENNISTTYQKYND